MTGHREMNDDRNAGSAQYVAEMNLRDFQEGLGPFVVAAETTRIPMIFTNAQSSENEIIYVNNSFVELTGFERADALGMPFHCLIAADEDRLNLTPQAIAGMPKGTTEITCLRRNRSVYEASVLSSPVIDADGTLKQHFISLFDLSGPVERRLQDHLRTAEIYRHAPGFIAFTSGPKHTFTFANAAYEALVGRDDLVGKQVAAALPDLSDQGVIGLLDKVFQSGERVVGKNTPVRLKRTPDGNAETRYLDFLYEPVRDTDGAIVGLFCEGSDITEARLVSEKLNETEAQLMHVSRMNAMGAMAATLAHELNQPLAAIANYASGCSRILEQSGVVLEDVNGGLSAITAASHRAGRIITGLRGMTRQLAPKRDVFDLSVALEESVHLVRAGGCNNVSITLKARKSFLVLGDRIQIQQVIVNLLRNACHAAEESQTAGRVIASATDRGGSPAVVIRDNGRGLPSNMIQDPFKWVESSKPDGMGIGLSICRTIVSAHGGRIALDKTGVTGTTFAFELPAMSLHED